MSRGLYAVVVIGALLVAVPSALPNAGAETAGEWSDAALLGMGGPADWGTWHRGEHFVAIDDLGAAIAVWTGTAVSGEWANASLMINASRFVPGSGWGSPETLFTVEEFNESLFGPQLAMNGAGKALVVWSTRSYAAGVYTVYARPFNPQTGWGTVQELAAVPWNSATGHYPDCAPQVAIDSLGNGLAAWTAWDGVAVRVFASQFTKATGWTGPVLVSAGVDDAFDVDLAMEPSGRAVAAWNQFNGTSDGVMGYSYTGTLNLTLAPYFPDTGWGTTQVIDATSDLEGSLGPPAVAISIQGQIGVAWSRADFNPFRLTVRGATYSTDSGLVPTSYANLGQFKTGSYWPHPRIAEDAQGHALITYSGWSDPYGNWTLSYARYEPMTGWTQLFPIETQFGFWMGQNALAMSPRGASATAWNSPDGVKAARFGELTGWSNGTVIPGQAKPTPGYAENAMGSLAVNSHGDAVVLWVVYNYTNTDTNSSVWASYSVGARQLALVIDSPLPGTVTSSPILVVSGRTEYAATVAVGGNLADVQPDGSFAATVWLSNGTNPIVVRARDPVGNEATVSFAVVYIDSTSGLREDLSGTRAALEDTQTVLGDTQASLRDAQAALDAANARVAAMERQFLLLGLAFVGTILVIALLFAYPRIRKGHGSIPVDSPPGATNGNGNNGLESEVLPLPPKAAEFPVWPRGPAAAPHVRLTAKERILLHLQRFIRLAGSPEVPMDMTQEGISAAASIDLRHFAQYANPLIADGLVRQRNGHVPDGKQRRRVYELTDTGQRVAARLVDRVKAHEVRVWDGEHVWDVRLGEILDKVKDHAELLEVVRSFNQAGMVDLATLTQGQGPGRSGGESEHDEGEE